MGMKAPDPPVPWMIVFPAHGGCARRSPAALIDNVLTMLFPLSFRFDRICRLRQRGDSRAIRKLAWIMFSDKDEAIRGEAVEALGSIRNEETIGPLLTALGNPSCHAREAAVRALGQYAKSDVALKLADALRDPEETVRLRAAESLGRIGEACVADVLHGSLEDESPAVQWAAAEALSRIGVTSSPGHFVAWVENRLALKDQPFSARYKLDRLTPIVSRYVEAMSTEQLRLVETHVHPVVRVASWEPGAGDDDGPGWVFYLYPHPMARPARIERDERLRRRRAELLHEEVDFDEHPGTLSFDYSEHLDDDAVESFDSDLMVRRPAARPEGAVASFLEFLRERHLESVVLTGPTIRDFALGEEPSELVFTVQVEEIEGLDPDDQTPALWNQAASRLVAKTLTELAAELDVGVDELVEGNVMFAHDGADLPLRYTGPFLIEEEIESLNCSKGEQHVHRIYPIQAMLAVRSLNRVIGLAPDASFHYLALDCDERWIGDYRRASVDLEIGHIRLDGPRTRLRLNDIFRLLELRHTLGFDLADDCERAFASRCAELAADPAELAEEFSAERFAGLLAASRADALIRDLDSLGLLESLFGLPDLDEDFRGRAEAMIVRRDAEPPI